MSNAEALHDLRAAQALIDRALQTLAANPVREPVQIAVRGQVGSDAAPARKPPRFLGCDEPQPAPEP